MADRQRPRHGQRPPRRAGHRDDQHRRRHRPLRRRPGRGPHLERRPQRRPARSPGATRSSLAGTGLIARYGLAEATGTAVNNSVAGGVNGTAVGGPLWVGGAPISAPANAAPVFTTDIANQTNSEGNVVSLDADATDADLDTLTYSATNLPGGITINSATGVISGTLSGDQLGHPQRRHHASRRHRHRHRPVHLDGRRRGRAQHGARLRRHQRPRHLRRRPPASACSTFTIETWFRRDGTGVGHRAPARAA